MPTVDESGVKNFEVVGFYGVLAPAKMPPDVIAKLNNAFRKTLAADDGKTRVVQQGADPAFLDSAQFAQFLQSKGTRWSEAVRKAGVKLD